MGFEPIFLIVEEILDFARRTGVPFSSRGSAASSLVAHCLGITSPDPLRLNLYFERFLNPARTTPPDIDTDLCSRRRDAVIQHVFDTYGAERVAMVGTINRFRPRSALGDVAKAHGLAAARCARWPTSCRMGSWPAWKKDEEGAGPALLLCRAAQRAILPRATSASSTKPKRCSSCRAISPCTGGLVVAPGALTDLVPVMRSGSKGVTITQFDLEAVEAFGLVKIDLLGIRGLTVLGDVAEFIHASQPERIYRPAGRARIRPRPTTRRPPTAWRAAGRSAASRSKARACAPPCARSTPAARTTSWLPWRSTARARSPAG